MEKHLQSIIVFLIVLLVPHFLWELELVNDRRASTNIRVNTNVQPGAEILHSRIVDEKHEEIIEKTDDGCGQTDRQTDKQTPTEIKVIQTAGRIYRRQANGKMYT